MRPNLTAEERNGQRDKCKHRPFRKDNKNNTFTVINKHETESKRESTDADSRCFLLCHAASVSRACKAEISEALRAENLIDDVVILPEEIGEHLFCL